MSLKIILYIVAGVLVVGTAGGIYWKIYNDGKQAVIVEQERKLKKIEDKTDAAKTDAFTTPDPNSELLKYSRPDK